MIQMTIIGNVGQDAELKEFNGVKFITFSVATNEKYTDSNGVKVERTSWISCLSKQVAVGQYLRAGTKVYVQGKPDIKMYKNRDNQQAIAVNLRVDKIELLSSKQLETATSGTTTGNTGTGEGENDLPF